MIVKIFGQVQGVFFRWNTQRVAQGLKIKGYTWNEPDGTVGIIAEGEEDSLKKLIEWCHKGPAGAKVKNVKIIWEKPKREFKNFAIKYT